MSDSNSDSQDAQPYEFVQSSGRKANKTTQEKEKKGRLEAATESTKKTGKTGKGRGTQRYKRTIMHTAR
jgi:hypothetical protein